jgi:hypothetical protein
MPRLQFLWLIAAAAPLSAAILDPVDDFRVGVAAQKSPTIHEELQSPSGGASKGLDWNGVKAVGIRTDVLIVQGPADPFARAGFAWVYGLSFASTNITPTSYDTGAGTSENAFTDVALTYRQYGGDLGLGWCSMPTDTELGSVHWEAFGLVRGGWATAQSNSPGVASSRSQGTAPWWEAGVVGSLVLCDDNWVFALNTGWMYGLARIDVDYHNHYSSLLTLVRNGPEVGLSLGYRF